MPKHVRLYSLVAWSLVAFAFLLAAGLNSDARAADSEADLRVTFVKQYKDKDPAVRASAVKTLANAREEKTVALLASALQDPAIEVRRAATDTLATAEDNAGVTAKPLAAIVADKKEQTGLRMSAATALSKEKYKSDAIPAFIKALSIEESEVLLYAYAFECNQLVSKMTGQDFGADKETPGKWAAWWQENKARIAEEDAKTLAEYKKSAGQAK